jgi:hypothetical protein
VTGLNSFSDQRPYAPSIGLNFAVEIKSAVSLQDMMVKRVIDVCFLHWSEAKGKTKQITFIAF